MATISRPSILLLDEHIATLDPRTAQTVMELTEMIGAGQDEYAHGHPQYGYGPSLWKPADHDAQGKNHSGPE
jgi:hypothetical protein